MSNAVTNECRGYVATPAQKSALMFFADRADEHGFVYRPSIASLMSWTCLGRTAAIGAIKDLEAQGAIRVERVTGKANRITVNVDAVRNQCVTRTSTDAEPVRQTDWSGVAATPVVDDVPAQPENRFHPKLTPLAQGVDETHLKDWIKARKSPLTETAWAGLKSEAAKAGISAAEAVRICAVKAWRGFDSTWKWQSVAIDPPPAALATEAARRAASDAEAKRLLGFNQAEVFDA